MRAQEFIVESVHAYHGTFQPTLTRFNALSHFGTLQAAEDRLKEKARREKIKDPGRVYEVVLDIKNPFIAKDFAGVHSPTHFVFDLKSKKLISQEELSAINQHIGTPKQAKLLIKKLRELGFDSIAYTNKYEDKGSTSYVILDPSQVVSVRPLKQKEAVTEARIPDEIEDFLYDLTPEDVGVEEFGPYRVHYEGFTDDCQSSSDYCANPEAVYQQVFADHIAREGGRKPIEQNFTGDEDYPILYSIFKIPRQVKERAERARDAIENIVTMGNIDDYFVRFTDVDKLGYSAQQDFGRMPDVGDADWNPDALPKKKGHPALWFYPASYYLRHKDLFADSRPYVWLVKRRPNAYLQPTQGATRPETPKGMVRAGLMHKESGVPVAVFFRPEFDVVDRWHEPKLIKENFADGKVKGKSRPGRVKKAGASCKGSVSSLRAKAKKYGGEKGKMYHWCANMKSGRSKK